jgi:hypothetical protein
VSFIKDLDTPLLKLSKHDEFTLRDACAGVHIFGGIGSGKTSGSGRMLAGSFLRAGMGGLVTAVKPEEVELWKRYANEHGRADSLVLLDEHEGFNFLNYELSRQGMDGIGTVTECLMRILEAAKKANPAASQRGGDAFWEDSTRMLLRYSILPLFAAGGSLSISDIIRFISAAPRSAKDVTDLAWQKRSFLYEVMDASARSPLVPMDRGALQNTLHYWSERWIDIPDKTRGNMIVSVAAVLDRFLHGRLQRVFGGRTTLVPEMSFHGAVIVMAMPTLTWNEDGVIAQHLFKYLWQRAVLNRNSLEQKHRDRPVFLWSDEAQETVNSFDAEYQSICRGSKAATVYLTQTLPKYYAKMGGDNPRDAAHGLVGAFMTNIFHSNACPDTNEYASRVIGKVMKRRRNYSSGSSETVNVNISDGSSENSGYSYNSGHASSYSSGGSGGSSSNYNSSSGHTSGSGVNWGSGRGKATGTNTSQGYSESMEYAIEPGDFARILKTGGRANGNLVTGVWFQGGKVFKETGTNVMLKSFKQ